MSLNIYTSNRMERLVEALAGVVGEPLSLPLAPEIIVVQSKGMQRWVAMELAKRFGVWANCSYPFPNAMMGRLYDLVMPDIPIDMAAYAPEVLLWKIMKSLPALLGREEFSQLRHYLTDDVSGLKLFQLSQRIADTFDQYTLFRTEMVAAWESEEEKEGVEKWQAVLWRTLTLDDRGWHRGHMREEFHKRLRGDGLSCDGMPERISVFGISYLPRYHMEMFVDISAITDVNLFLLSPTREYWADIVSKKVAARLTGGASVLRTEGHPLLASLGRMGRDFSDVVIETGDVASLHEELYEEPDRASLLGQIQGDILALCDFVPEGEKRPVAPADRSLQIHSCHSPLREIEVLHDNLLALIENINGLEPRDIVVMTPDIETYAPYIASVFEGGHDPSARIPYSIADRRLKNEGKIAGVILKLLGLFGSRLTSVQLLDILGELPVRRRFDLDDKEMELLRDWTRRTAIRWGIDEKSRLDFGLPGYRENSWLAGLDRLLLGYALPDEDGLLFQGILPFDAMEGAETRTLGKFSNFIHMIDELTKRLALPRTLAGWREECGRLLSDFIAADEEMAGELAEVAGVVAQMEELAEKSGYGGVVSLDVIKAWLTLHLERQERGFGFMTGGVTFCAMLPMRSIPFKVVALIGMNDGAFPRKNFSPGFDLVALNPRRGDRSLRDEDRYLFLEALLSARECFYVSYVGQSIKDNSEIPPSVLVSELLDAIDRSFEQEGGGEIVDHLVTRHRLQPFSRDYFAVDSPLFSYSSANFEALRESWAGGGEALKVDATRRHFLTKALAAPASEWRDVSLLQLQLFFRNPAKFFLKNRLGIAFEEIAAPLAEREPFSLEGLDAYDLKRMLLDITLRGGNAGDYLGAARSRGLVPPAHHGEVVFAEALDEVGKLARRVLDKIGGTERLAPLDVELDLEGFRLTGRLDGVWSEHLVRFRTARKKAKDIIFVWMEHLFLNAAGAEGYPSNSLLVMEDLEVSFLPVTQPLPILQSLLGLYWQGLMKPLEFLPASSYAYAEGGKWLLDKARKEWEDDYTGRPGEKRDPCFHLCFGEEGPFDGEFERVAHVVLEPLLIHLK